MTAITDPRARPPTPSAPVAVEISTRLLRGLRRTLPYVLGGYALLDRGFAWIHVPGTPAFVAELCLAASVLWMALDTRFVRRAVGENMALRILAAYVLWCLVRTAPGLGTFGLAAVRDAALWYYALFAFVVVALCTADESWLGTLERKYRRFLPYLLAWLPVALFTTYVTPVFIPVPDSGVSILNYRAGNIGVHALIATAFLLVAVPRQWRWRMPLLVLGFVDLALAGTQNRGGLVGALAGLVALALLTRLRLHGVGRLLAVLVVVFGMAWMLDIRVSTSRDLSVRQLVANVTSIVGADSADSKGHLDDTREWRSELWSRINENLVESGQLEFGAGYGPNLAAGAGVAADTGEAQDADLRSPHNSHLDVVARAGLVGGILWGVVWVYWCFAVVRAWNRARWLPDGAHRQALLGVCFAGVVAILVNGYFDPTLEGAQVSVWLWTLYAVGVVVMRQIDVERRDRSWLHPAPAGA